MKLLFYNSFRYRHEDLSLLDYTHLWMGEQYVSGIRFFVSTLQSRGISCEAMRDFNRDSADAFALWEMPRASMGEFEEEGYRYILASGKPIYAFLMEPPMVSPEGVQLTNTLLIDKLFTWHRDLFDHCKYFPIRPMFFDLASPAGSGAKFQDKKLCAIIGHVLSGLFTSQDAIYSRRKDVLDWFAANHPNDMDLYGKQPYGVGTLKQYPFFRGAAESKRDTLTGYRFSFCYENSRYPDYISEKLFDCFLAGCVPIYIGAPNVTDYVPRDAFIDPEEFRDLAELYQYLCSMKESEYFSYLRSGRTVLKTSFAQSYLPEHFTTTVLNAMGEHT